MADSPQRDSRRTTKWAWRANGSRRRQLEGFSDRSEIEERELARLMEWFEEHDEPKARSQR